MESKYLIVNEEKSYEHDIFGRVNDYSSVQAQVFDTYDAAEKKAKIKAHKNQKDYLIFKAVAHVEAVVPEMKVTKLVK